MATTIEFYSAQELKASRCTRSDDGTFIVRLTPTPYWLNEQLVFVGISERQARLLIEAFQLHDGAKNDITDVSAGHAQSGDASSGHDAAVESLPPAIP